MVNTFFKKKKRFNNIQAYKRLELPILGQHSTNYAMSLIIFRIVV